MSPKKLPSDSSSKNKDIRHLVRSDVNLEKWNIFTTRANSGYRVLERQRINEDGSRSNLSVAIGLPDSKLTLTAMEAKIFYLLLNIWDDQGRPVNGVVSTTINYILNNLSSNNQNQSGKALRYSQNDKKWLLKHFDNMNRVIIQFRDKTYQTHEEEDTAKSFTLIEDFNVYSRSDKANQKEFGLTTIKLHPQIIDSILHRKVKPIRKDVIVSLRKDISVILYRYLDLMLSSRTFFERNVTDLGEELSLGARRSDHLLEYFREAAAELTGKELSTGRIVKCEVVPKVKQRGWKLVVQKGQFFSLKSGEKEQSREEYEKDILARFSTIKDGER
ncbi:MAG: hypothetical protein JNJ47_06545, partial [Alphaproteobacteria bacterium]|nr:hypothetical protein [Alphaproteobacteria bacterium]